MYHTHSFFSLCLLDSVLFTDETFTCIALYPRVWLNSWVFLKIDYSRTISLLYCRCYGPLVRWENPFSPVYKIQQYRESSARLQNILADYWQKKIKKCHGNNSGYRGTYRRYGDCITPNVIRSIQSKALSVSDLSPPFVFSDRYTLVSLWMCEIRTIWDLWTQHEW